MTSTSSETCSQKYLRMILDNKLNFEHLNKITPKVNKTIGAIHNLRNILPQPTILTIYKPFIRPHLDYGDILYIIKHSMNLFKKKLESLQYNPALATAGAIIGFSTEKMYQGCGIEYLKHKR